MATTNTPKTEVKNVKGRGGRFNQSINRFYFRQHGP